ncbi:uncharacterized protein [Elaeis guineensis]|uniref:Uncharacterized protein LOC105042920 isoform X2 n=1 Tax=Elaeis guineensis var. tenera TaxID=51953 RepID=A0A8N4ID56_ELAGV|nr:uncharacterized protein LOC105042920 isoform X2 [Elaeis guineensis]
MANQGAKKRKEENKKHMAMLLRVIIASNIPAFGAYKVLGLLKGILSECSKNCLMEKEVEVSPIQSQAVEAAGNKTEALC